MAVTVKAARTQVVIPRELQERAGFKPGDELEWKASRGKLTLVAKPVKQHPLLAAFAECQAAAKKAGTDKMTMREINALIKKVRKERREQGLR
ncbi:MAG: AbrB/MazE/SpoVT family DNA-binding domain-containing protein [Acidobacteria bacterium]|nr:AbrB/MazE/SpoVT family DNA-binding domain-containing protein [Acidobacteriota bacterium]